MSKPTIFPTGDTDLSGYVDRVIPYVLANSVRLNLSADNNTLITDLKTAWDENWKLFIDITKRTSVVTRTKTSLRGQLEKALRGVYNDIPKTALTIDDRNELNLKARAPRGSRTPCMKKPPTITLQSTQHLQHRLRFKNPETPESNAVPRGQRIVLEYFVGPANLQEKAIVFMKTKNVSRFMVYIRFTDADVAQTCYYHCCYENTHGERSAWSMVINGVVA